ncbi:MFS transporter [Janthinobacterium agaricidamnosum]|uniref:Major Facilitator Superfamily protein n=1 Tax=Janthinobacterium agaricidamnosum NBRC 102515 = DSM 9628 TaxID=1349767 RepID=W0V646_9BURK|nr:MFS transporter [Janthinobacterium agaricidamnosum]CDG83060.1 major Facilitator Superfamily protein [Janthinobacterium agaricidamnosum NBRC 102515 = DSM 9628]
MTATGSAAVPGHASAIDEDRLYSKVSWRLMPFLCLGFVGSYLDRVNVGFAKLLMLSDLQWSETVYGLGAGIFFLGYVLLEVPSNLILHKIGARRWLARIMITWAIISGATAFVTTPMQFYIARFLLGVAEAGFLPGVLLYLTYWYPANRRSLATAMFVCAIPLSGIVGGPLSGWILKNFHAVGGLAAWQWVFLLEAIPSLVIGAAMLVYLNDGIRKAGWLSEAEKQLLERNIEKDTATKHSHSLRAAFSDRRVWLLSLTYFTTGLGNYALLFWLPSLIQATGVKDVLNIGLLSAIPYIAGVAVMFWWSNHSDQRQERRWHAMAGITLGAFGLALSTFFGDNTALAVFALTLASIGIMSFIPVFWGMPTALLGGVAAAAGIGVIASVGNMAGFFSPYLIGWFKDATHSTNSALLIVSALMMAGGVVMVTAFPARQESK